MKLSRELIIKWQVCSSRIVLIVYNFLSVFRATVDQCGEIKRHHDAIIASLTSQTDFIKLLQDSYDADTDTVREELKQ